MDNPINDGLRLVFHFSEKLQLPHLLRQPEQIPFITGLKIYFYWVSFFNLKTNDIYCMPECHWPSGKTSEEMASMPSHSISIAKSELENLESIRTLQLHAYIVMGQNKISLFSGTFFLERLYRLRTTSNYLF